MVQILLPNRASMGGANGAKRSKFRLLLIIIKWLIISVMIMSLLHLVRIATLICGEFTSDTHTDMTINVEHEVWKQQEQNHQPKIPKRVHQIWIGYNGRPMPQNFRESARQWAVVKNYELMLWNYTSIEHLLSQHYSWFVDTWRGYSYTMNRVDSAKYFLLHHYGGIYADMDVRPDPEFPDIVNSVTKTIRDGEKEALLAGERQVLLVKPTSGGVNPEVIVGPRGHPFFSHCIRGLPNANRFYLLGYIYAMAAAGPWFLTARYSVYPKNLRDRHFKVLDYEAAFKVHRLYRLTGGASWYTWDTKLVITVIYFGLWHGKMVPQPISALVLLITFLSCVVLIYLKCCRGRKQGLYHSIKIWSKNCCKTLHLKLLALTDYY